MTSAILEHRTLPSSPTSDRTDLDAYAPFVMKEWTLSDRDPKVTVTILRDSAASQSATLEGVLPLSGQFAIHSFCFVPWIWHAVCVSVTHYVGYGGRLHPDSFLTQGNRLSKPA